MSSAEAQIIYNQAPLQERDEAQETFARHYDLSHPERAMSTYQKVMHQHTKQQFDMAQTSSRRRSNGADNELATLSSETSNASVSSTSS